MTRAEKAAKLYDWNFWARDNQLLPQGNWIHWLILAGRGWGKTRVGAETVHQWVKNGYKYINIIAATESDIEKVMIHGPSGIMSVCPKSERPRYIGGNKKQLIWPNGAVSLVFSAEAPDRLRGPQHDKLWADELAAWRYPDAWDQALLGLRLGNNPQAIITTTPRPTKIIKELARDPKTVITRGSSYENAFNLAEAFINKVIRKYENTRIGRQELYAEILEQVQGALWTQDLIDDTRVGDPQLPDLRRVVVAIDPAVTSKENSDETGVIVAGIDGRNPPHAYILSDKSGRFTPIDWAKTAIHAYYGWRADRIVAEINNGGEMVENTLRQVDPNVSYTPVIASRGKMIRAEPISSLYEQRRIHHVGVYEELEEQMVTYTYDYDRASNGSPDRMDALVWALTELLVTGSSYDSSMSWVS